MKQALPKLKISQTTLSISPLGVRGQNKKK